MGKSSRKRIKILTFCSSPESSGFIFDMAGLLTCFGFMLPSRRKKPVAKECIPLMKLTATGIVPDFHRIPF
jgi:hypothetical protein